jgi:hypothetical protein
MGYIARKGKITDNVMREAVVYGNVMGSFAVEEFSINKFLDISYNDIEKRYNRYKSMVSF